MSHALQISDEAYRILSVLARARGSTPEAIVEAWAQANAPSHEPPERDPFTEPRYYTTEEWFRHLGANEELIRRAHDLAQRPDDDADA